MSFPFEINSKINQIIRYFIGFLLFLCCINIGSMDVKAVGRVQDPGDNIVVVIDPGHGGENEGTIENGFQEKSMTMITAKAMYDALSQYDGITVYLTRTDDKDMTLKERAEFASEVGADFLFSIHYNASLKHNLFGAEVWISSVAPYHAYGYQFGYTSLTGMQEMGLFLRGVKTRLNDKGTDYYGIIREAAALKLPAVIIEHCHVDEDRDVPFCDSKEDLIAFGQADAKAVAQYFGLKSSTLGTDYSNYPINLPQASELSVVEQTRKDETPPDVCMVTLEEADYDTGLVRLTVSGADYDSVLLYYDYSIDGGTTYSPLQPWPESNALTGSYKDTFSLELAIPSGVMPSITVRAYNLSDGVTQSNELISFQVFRYGQESIPSKEAESALPAMNSVETASALEGNIENTTQTTPIEQEESVSIITFLKICLICVAFLLVLVLLAQVISNSSRKRRRHNKKVAGDRKNQLR